MLGVALERGERAHVVRLELEHFLPARKCARLVAQLIEEFSHLAQENQAFSRLTCHVCQAPERLDLTRPCRQPWRANATMSPSKA